MILFLALLSTAPARARDACVEVRLARDDAHIVTRQAGAPDVGATDRAGGLRTREASRLVLKARRRDLGCIDFDDVRAFEYAYRDAGLPPPAFVVMVNDDAIRLRDGRVTFPPDVANLVVTGLVPGDRIDIYVVVETDPPALPPTADGTARTLRGTHYLTMEKRTYVY